MQPDEWWLNVCISFIEIHLIVFDIKSFMYSSLHFVQRGKGKFNGNIYLDFSLDVLEPPQFYFDLLTIVR